MDTILWFAITNIISFTTGAFLHKWLAAKVVQIIDPASKGTPPA